MKTNAITILVLLAGLAGCAKSDPFAETLEARGQNATNLANEYRRGQKLIDDGRDNIENGRDLVNRGNRRINQGQDQVREGEALKASARASYCAQTGAQDQACY